MTAPDQWDRAVIVFADQTRLWWLRLLRPGFRHCFVCLAGAGGWVVVDALSHRTEISHLPLPTDYDLPGWYRHQGMQAIETVVHSPVAKALAWRPHSCVEVVKRVLGLSAPWVLTPWQLYRHLSAGLKKEYNP